MTKKNYSIKESFKNIEDPRIGPVHQLIDVIVITISAVICGADDWPSVVQFGKSKEEWLQSILELSGGIPGVDTFRRVFTLLDPKKFEDGFLRWVKSISKNMKGEIIAIDGKVSRRAFESGENGQSAIHLVSAWAVKNKLILGQRKVDRKSNEITAIPELLDILELEEAVVTIDAMGCQENIAGKIIEKGGNYVLALKGNQGNTLEGTEHLFKHYEKDNYDEIYDTYQDQTFDHGRIEKRIYRTITEIDFIREFTKKKWPGLKSIAMVESTRESKLTGEKTTEKRYYLSSLSGNAKEIGDAIRGHWGVENSLHWNLDISFREDDSRMRKGNSAENFALIRRLALSLLKRDTKTKLGIKNKRLKAGWDEDYLLGLLCNIK